MGISISVEKYEKIERNRREGRLCATGGGRAGCATRANYRVISECWMHQIGEGESHVSSLPSCKTHLRGYAAGFEGVNFRVLAVEKV